MSATILKQIKDFTIRPITALAMVLGPALAPTAVAQEVLPFPPKASGNIAGRTMQDSIYSPLPLYYCRSSSA
jgi:hypothetical protein